MSRRSKRGSPRGHDELVTGIAEGRPRIDGSMFPPAFRSRNTELPSTDAGVSALVNEKFNELPGCTSSLELSATN